MFEQPYLEQYLNFYFPWLKIPDIKIMHFKILMYVNICTLSKQRNDEWTGAIEQRISGCIDFVASKAVYHP